MAFYKNWQFILFALASCFSVVLAVAFLWSLRAENKPTAYYFAGLLIANDTDGPLVCQMDYPRSDIVSYKVLKGDFMTPTLVYAWEPTAGETPVRVDCLMGTRTLLSEVIQLRAVKIEEPTLAAAQQVWGQNIRTFETASLFMVQRVVSDD